MLIAAILLLAMSTPPADEGWHAIFDASQSGGLPAVVVDRPAEAFDGAIVAPDNPRWGSPVATADALHGWTKVWENPSDLVLHLAGYDQDNATPLMAAFDGMQMKLHVFLGERLQQGPVLTKSMWRNDADEPTVDVLVDTPGEQANYAYRPRAGTVLPGCVVMLCQRSIKVFGDEGDTWIPEGISLVALDHIRGIWSLRLIGDVPAIAGGTSHMGRSRLYPSSLENYFPAVDGMRDGELVEAWLPFVDYMLHTPIPARAGQVAMARAYRVAGMAPWQFEGPILLHEFVGGEKRHTHAAAWTPNGVLFSIGDGADSEVSLLTHDPALPWTNPEAWTLHRDMHGAPLSDDEGGDVGANQFWAVAPGPTLDTIICGGDNVSGSVMQTTIPVDPADGLTFKRIWGVQPGDTGDGGDAQCTCSLMHRLQPEFGGPVLSRTYLESPQTQANEARLLLSKDGTHFATVAGMRVSGSKLSPAALLGESILTTPMSSQVDSGLYAMPRPNVSVQRPLQIAPGTTNQLYAQGNKGELTASSLGGTSVTLVERDGAGLLGDLAAAAPGNAPVWHVHRADPGDPDLLSITLPAPTAGWPEGMLWAQLHVCNLTSGMLRPEARFDLGAQAVRHRVAVASKHQWAPFDLITPLDSPTAGEHPVIEVSIPVTAPAPPVDFLITLESLTANVAPPWPSPEPRGDRPPERVSMDLPDPVDTWTLEVDCHIPSMGVDKGLGDRFGFVPLFTLHRIDGSLLEVRAEPLYARVMLVHIAADGTEMELIRQYDARLARLDTLRIEVAAMPGGIGMSAVSGGHRGEPVRTPGRPFFDLSAIDSITFGDAQGQLKVPLDLLRVSLWPGQADINVGIEWESGDLSCDADLDQDGWVTGADILVLLMWWGDCPERDGKDEVDCLADLNEDGLVDIHDLLLLLVDLGPCDDTHVP